VFNVSDKTLAEKLQDEFKCSECGFCCSRGGQIKITKQELEIIGEFLEAPITCAALVPVRELEAEPGVYVLTVTEPCFFMDKMANTCMIHLVKPQFCRDYPWKLYLKGGCTLLDVMCCPVARDQIERVFR
jgi:Fe-S-cluster containining protein